MMLTKSKALKASFVKALKLPLSDEEEKKFSPFSMKIRKIAEKIANVRILGRRIGYTLKIVDDIEMFGVKDALSYFKGRAVYALTFKHFRGRLRSGIDYFKKGYNSYDFDSGYALEEFVWKLERIGNHIKACDNHVDSHDDYEHVQEVVALLKRVMADDYLEEFEKEVAEKYGDSIRYEANCDGLWGFCNKGKGPFKSEHVGSVVINRREEWTPETHYEIEKAERAKYSKADRKRKHEWHKALMLIEKNLFAWWD